jgi:ABC-type glycerol-3-phosphate transport system substrate-binding protein
MKMRIRRWSVAVVAMLMLAAVSACSFTTANISSLKLSKDKEGTVETTNFAPGDTIYAKATVSNVPSKVTLKFRVFTDDVEGQPKNAPVPNFEKTFDVPSDGYVDYYLTPPSAGWPSGKYRIDVAMLIQSGEQKDQEAVSFTVSR